MGDAEIIEKIAELWIELGGDAEGFTWCYSAIKEAIARLSEGEDE